MGSACSLAPNPNLGLTRAGMRRSSLGMSITNRKSVQMIGFAVKRYGRLDLPVNNAGISVVF
jgi:NAD(P)-dependent dehydrogenase (short-subunit alcohol dehydrogenase family)